MPSDTTFRGRYFSAMLCEKPRHSQEQPGRFCSGSVSGSTALRGSTHIFTFSDAAFAIPLAPKSVCLDGPLPSFPVPSHLTDMVDFHTEQAAHKTEGCPACKGTMNLVEDSYKCEQCGHFRQNPQLQTLLERGDRTNLTFCKCEYCLKHPIGETS